MKNKKNNKGFTLVELLVVIAIIGILAVVAVPALFKNIEKGKIADLEADMSAIRSAVLSYYADNSEYPMDDTNKEQPGGEKPIKLKPSETVPTDDTRNGTLAIKSELEGLSFPFGGKYELTNADGDIAVNTAVKAPADLHLKIVTSGPNSTISSNGLEKLSKDLGISSTLAVTVSKDEDKDTSDTDITTGGQVIILPLVKMN